MNTQQSYVYLSYVPGDMAVAEQVREVFHGEDLNTRIVESVPFESSEWAKLAEQSIEDSGAMVVILSPEAKKSLQVERELDYARSHDVTVFPVLARGEERDSIPFELITNQRVDIRSGMDAIENALIPSVATHIGAESITQRHQRLAREKAQQEAEAQKEAKREQILEEAQPSYHELSAEDLMEFFQFTAEDLQANQRRQLSERQVWTIRMAKGGFRILVIILGFVLAFFGGFYLIDSLDYGDPVSMGLGVFIALFGLAFVYVSGNYTLQTLSPKIKIAEGKIHRTDVQGWGEIWDIGRPMVQFGDVELPMPNSRKLIGILEKTPSERWNEMEWTYPGPYRVYYWAVDRVPWAWKRLFFRVTPLDRILSVEPVNKQE